MSWIIKFVNRIAKPNVPKPIYGRWGMEYKPNQVDARIDLANEDHCGPCGTYALSKENEQKRQSQTLSYDEAVKYGIMKRRRGFHSMANQSNLLEITSSLSNNMKNGCDSISGDYMAGLPPEIALEYPETNNDGPDEDPDDDNKGPSPVVVAASLLASYRITYEQLNN